MTQSIKAYTWLYTRILYIHTHGLCTRICIHMVCMHTHGLYTHTQTLLFSRGDWGSCTSTSSILREGYIRYKVPVNMHIHTHLAVSDSAPTSFLPITEKPAPNTTNTHLLSYFTSCVRKKYTCNMYKVGVYTRTRDLCVDDVQLFVNHVDSDAVKSSVKVHLLLLLLPQILEIFRINCTRNDHTVLILEDRLIVGELTGGRESGRSQSGCGLHSTFNRRSTYTQTAQQNSSTISIGIASMAHSIGCRQLRLGVCTHIYQATRTLFCVCVCVHVHYIAD